jgi:holo-[acyl-carrier protein] synthase
MLERFGDSFLERVFTEKERAEANVRRDPSEYYAGRWAAKEAASKALGCGIGESCGWKDLQILNGSAGQPCLTLSGKALETAHNMGVDNIHLSVSHEREYACSTVILEKNGHSA